MEDRGAELAASLARLKLARPLPGRWLHTRGVAAKAAATCQELGLTDVPILAAWLHDIGYSPTVAETGFHPLDGARYLRRQGWDSAVTQLVAHHSCAAIEASHRGWLQALINEFSEPDERNLAVLTHADMSVGPAGQPMTFRERIEEIKQRYEPDSIVHRSIAQAEPLLRAQVESVEAWLSG